MRKLIRKILICAVQENPKEVSDAAQINKPKNTLDDWQLTRINELEENVKLIMEHLGVWVKSGKRLERFPYPSDTGAKVAGETQALGKIK